MKAGFLKRNWFSFGIVLTVLIGALLPGGNVLNAGSRVTNVVTILLFLITGMSIPTETIWSDLREAKLHLFNLGFVFVLVPLYFWASSLAFHQLLDQRLLIGLYALACLPTTVSSCVVFTQTAGGNAMGAVFNSTAANLIGVLLSPLLLSLLIRETHVAMPLSDLFSVLRSLSLRMLVPLAAGQLLRVPSRGFLQRKVRTLSTAANALLLVVVYFGTASAASNSQFADTLRRAAPLFLYLAASHLLLAALAWFGAKAIGLRHDDVIASVFVAPQKTLAMGVPLISIYFASRPDLLGVALLPALFYHPWQLLVAGILRGWILRRAPGSYAADFGAATPVRRRG